MPESEVAARKDALRRAMRLQLRAVLAERQEQARTLLPAVLDSLPALSFAHRIAAFAPFGGEPDILPWLDEQRARGVTIGLPRTLVDDRMELREFSGSASLERGRFGVREPAANARVLRWESMDAVLVPGAAFDHAGRRLGWGMGYYDRVFARLPQRIPRIAVAWPWQVVDAVPVGARDELVHAIATIEGIVECRK